MAKDKQVIVIDLDGVLVNWNAAYHRLLGELGAPMRPFEDGKDPDRWHYEEAYGATAEQVKEAWKIIRANPNWWLSLPVHPDMEGKAAKALLQDLCELKEVTFVTSRPPGSRFYTQRWLDKHFGLGEVPTILTPHDKVPALVGLHPDVVIEDKLDTLVRYLPHRSDNYKGCHIVNRRYNFGGEALLPTRIKRFANTVAALEASL